MRRATSAIAVVAGSLLLAGSLAAAETMPDFQRDPVEEHTATVLVWILVAAIVLVLLCIQRVWQGRISGLAGKAVLLVALVVLPVVSLSSGMMLVFVRAERVEFCGSCHEVMEEYVADLRDPGSEGLAAVHYRNRYIPSNQCYECHTSYGLFGTFRAKVSGVMEVVRYYTNSYERPLAMREPYPNADCLKCHAGSVRWLAVQEHVVEGRRKRMVDDRLSCLKCHAIGSPVHPVASRGAE